MYYWIQLSQETDFENTGIYFVFVFIIVHLRTTIMAARVSSDHASESLTAANLQEQQQAQPSSTSSCTQLQPRPRPYTAKQLKATNAAVSASDPEPPFLAVIDGYVVEANEFLKKSVHPGGVRKILSANEAQTGTTGTMEFDFSFSSGRNAHFPRTAKTFRDGVKRYLQGDGKEKCNAESGSCTDCESDKEEETFLPSCKVHFPGHGSIVIVGKLV